MTRIHERVPLAVYPLEAVPLLRAYFHTLVGPEGTAEIRLHLSLPNFVGHVGFALEHNVLASMRESTDASGLNTAFAIAWRPEGGGPLPALNGMLTTWADADDERSYLDLDGSYEPPGSLPGALFDAAIGHRIAAATAHEFLIHLKIGRERLQAATAHSPTN